MTMMPSTTEFTPKVVIWLKRDVGGETAGQWLADRFVLHTSGAQTNISFTGDKSADCVIAREVWDHVSGYLPEVAQTRVLTAPDVTIETSGLLLQGIGMTGQRALRGVQRVILIFNRVIGFLQTMFAPGQAPSVLHDVECGLCTKTLNDIILPAINLATTDQDRKEAGIGDRLTARLDALRQNRHEIEFYLGLISRFVTARERPRTPVPDKVPVRVVPPGPNLIIDGMPTSGASTALA